MALHDWTRVPAGLFHHFHQSWSIRIADILNAGRLPKGVAALVEQRAAPRETDVLAIEARNAQRPKIDGNGGVVTTERPVTRFVRRTTPELYARRASRVVVKHHLGRILAIIEIVPPGNKDSRASLGEFVEKTVEFLRAGIHLLVVDPFPPTPRDPFGIHKAIWDEFVEEDFVLPEGKDRTLVSYEVGSEYVAYVEPIGVGDVLPDMSLFLWYDLNVRVPLESTYMATWESSPIDLRTAVESGLMPEAE
jgi:hypothetical protein